MDTATFKHCAVRPGRLSVGAAVVIVALLIVVVVWRQHCADAAQSFISGGGAVPVGTIVAYWGKMAPEGWLLCNGTPIPPKYETLRNLVGARTPDLQGYFLRGFDPNGVRDKERQKNSKSLGSPQDDAVSAAGLEIESSGEHRHGIRLSRQSVGGNSNERAQRAGNEDDGAFANACDSDGKHSHKIIGGDSETRPKNVAVNYIIKL